MTCIRPATPGFIVTLLATILLAVVSFCVPYFKSVFFLKADFSVGGHNGTITFGTLGYCLELSNGTSCSKPSIGYQLDINTLVGNTLPVQIPQVAVKWITYALFLHVIGLILAAISAVFGLLAHVREMSMACCSTCISGFAAGVTLIAFIFDIVLFFIAKARINAIGAASMGYATWLTLTAWLLLFFSGCFFAVGRCCISKRGPRSKWGKRDVQETGGPDTGYSEQMRMEAIKAEAQRKAMQANENRSGGSLPAFYETLPLTARVDGDSIYTDKDDTSNNHSGGYAPVPKGARAVDEFYHPTQPTPRRQQSGYAPPSTPHRNPSPRTSPPPLNNQYLSAAALQDPSTTPGQGYGHTAGGSSYHTAASHHLQQSSQHSQHDNHSSRFQPPPSPPFNPDVYNSTGIFNSSSPPPMPSMHTPNPYTTIPPSDSYTHTSHTSSSTPNPYTHNSQTPHTQPYTAPQRQYTLGGDGYGLNSVPPLPAGDNSSYFHDPGPSPYSAFIAPASANTGYSAPSQFPPTGPAHGPDDAPPQYIANPSGMTGHWDKH